MNAFVYLKNPLLIIRFLRNHRLLDWLPDKQYLELVFLQKMGRRLDLNNPVSFSEKLQWMKLYDRKPIYTVMVDKFAAKEYVAKLIGEAHIVPTYGVWNRFEDIPFESLPNQFVLKCTHDSGGLVLCRNKDDLDKKAAKEKIDSSLNTDYYKGSREWPYKDVPHRIIAERYMEDNDTIYGGIRDYKFFCFNGEPKFVYISEGLENHATAHIIFLDMNWEKADFQRIDYKSFDKIPPKPQKFDEMVTIAKKLAEGLDFIRVDLYQINGEVFFSELTFFPCGGFIPFEKAESDISIGQLLKITKGEQRI